MVSAEIMREFEGKRIVFFRLVGEEWKSLHGTVNKINDKEVLFILDDGNKLSQLLEEVKNPREVGP